MGPIVITQAIGAYQSFFSKHAVIYIILLARAIV